LIANIAGEPCARAGALWSLPVYVDGPAPLVLRGQGLEVPIPPPPESMFVMSLVVHSPERLAISDGVHVRLFADGRWEQVGDVPRNDVAFAADGTVYVSTRTDDEWRVGPLGRPPRWRVALDRDTREWGDGPPARAHGSPAMFAINGDRLLFYDRGRHAVRRVDSAGITTLAGSRSGRHDGPGADARFFDVAAIQALPGGAIDVVEYRFDELTVRRISPVLPR
jgi:hypothetical protein